MGVVLPSILSDSCMPGTGQTITITTENVEGAQINEENMSPVPYDA